MTKLEELLDAVLTLVAEYPVTFFRLLFAPQRAFDSTQNCSPGAFFFVSLAANYLAIRAAFAREHEALPKWLDKDVAVAVTVAYFAVLVTLQRAAIVRFFGGRNPQGEQVRALFYPVGLLLMLVLVFVTIPVVIVGLSAPLTLGFAVSNVVYCWVLYNVCRFSLGIPARQAIGAAVVGYAIVIVMPAAVAAAWYLGLFAASA